MRQSFMDPAPVGYLKTLHEQLLSDSEGAAGCYTDHYNKWLYGAALPDANGTESENRDFAEKTFVRMDRDGDGKVSVFSPLFPSLLKALLLLLQISLSDAVKSFPPAGEVGAIRTPENDGAAFIKANDHNGDGVVTLDELETSMRSWTRVMHEVGKVWEYVDGQNAAANGGFMDYGRMVDSIRFNYTNTGSVGGGKQVEFVFDEQGNAQQGKSSAAEEEDGGEDEGYQRGMPQPAEMDADVLKEPAKRPGTALPPTADFPVHIATDANTLFATVQGEPIGFLLWWNDSARFLGHFNKDGKRVGKGIYYSSRVFEEQTWEEGEDGGGFNLRYGYRFSFPFSTFV